MTISITSPTSTTSKIQQNGNDVLTVDSSNNVTVINNLSVSGTVSSTGAITFDGGVSGDVNFDSGTLYVDATNNRVGIGTSSPSSPLTVSTASGAVGARVISTSSGTLGPDLSLYHNSSSPADNDIISLISFLGNDSGGTSTTYSQIRAIANDVTDTTEDGTIAFLTTSGGTLAERMRIDSSGNVLVGTTTIGTGPTTGFNITYAGGSTYSTWGHVSGTGAGQPWCVFAYNGSPIGSIVQSGTTATQFNTTSDYRLKENNVNITDGIDRIKLLKPYRFNFITEPNRTVDGFYAHEVQSVVPEAINGTHNEVDDEGNPVYQGIDQSKLVPLLTAALQEAIARIEDLETRIQALENN